MEHISKILKQYKTAQAWAKAFKKRYGGMSKKEFEAWLRK